MKDTMKDIMKNNKDIVFHGILIAVVINLGAIVLRLILTTISGVPMLSSVQAMTIVAGIVVASLMVAKDKYISYNLVVVVTTIATAWLVN